MSTQTRAIGLMLMSIGLLGCSSLPLAPIAEETAAGRWSERAMMPTTLPVPAPSSELVQPAVWKGFELAPNPLEEIGGWAQRLPPLSPGDRIRLSVRDGKEFSGVYEVQLDGSLDIAFLPSLQVAGRTLGEIEALVGNALVQAGYFRPGLIQLSLDVQQWSSVEVFVSGAVFAAGKVSINQRQAEERQEQAISVSGDAASDRVIEAALRAAGGIRPDADLAGVVLQRAGVLMRLDLRPLVLGYPVPALPLMSGDRIHVPSTGHFNEDLVRPSAITPPGMRVFYSNLTTPAPANSLSGIDRDSTRLPYGSRFITALISANCVGGTGSTNSAREAVLVSFNPIAGTQEVITRPIEQVLSQPQDSALNPLLMPNDAVACYDSGVTNLRDIARSVADILLPFKLGL